MTEPSTPQRLLREATSDLTPDVEHLVAGGLARGRRRLRRRRAGTALAAVAVFGVIGTVAGVALSGGGGPGERAIDPAASSATPTHPPTSEPVPDATLGVTSTTVPEVFGRLEPDGEVTTFPVPGNETPGAPIVDFQWNGYAIRVGITADDYISGVSEPDPMKRCVQQGQQPCRPGADGTVVSTGEFTGPKSDGGVTNRLVTVFRPDGWDVLAMAANAGAGKDAAVLSPEPPFTIAELTEVASSDAWFE